MKARSNHTPYQRDRQTDNIEINSSKEKSQKHRITDINNSHDDSAQEPQSEAAAVNEVRSVKLGRVKGHRPTTE